MSSLELKVNITQDMNGNVYTCQSTNEALQRSVHEAVNLQVLCKCVPGNAAEEGGFLRLETVKNTILSSHLSDPPKFSPPPSSTAVGVEGESLTVAMVATGNPMSIAYTWTKDGLPILSSGKCVSAAYCD